MKRSKLFPGTKVSRNSGLYLLEYWKKDSNGWTLDSTRSGGSKRWAELVAKDLLKPVVCTKYTYHRDMGRADYIKVIKADFSEKTYTIDPEATIVPSVGELGYW